MSIGDARRAAVLAAVHRRAAQLRRRRRALVVAPTTLVVAIAAVGVWSTRRAPHDTNLAVVATTTTARAGTSTTHAATTTATTRVAATTTTTRKPASTTTPRRATSTTSSSSGPTSTVTLATIPPSCHNSYDPACGAFAWVPAPSANSALQVSVVASDLAPHAGDAVSITIDAADPDAVPACGRATVNGTGVALTDSAGHPVPGCPVACPGPTRHGPWTPPPRQGGSRRWFGSFTATGSGAQPLVVVADSGSGCPYLPYGSSGSSTVTITVS